MVAGIIIVPARLQIRANWGAKWGYVGNDVEKAIKAN